MLKRLAIVFFLLNSSVSFAFNSAADKSRRSYVEAELTHKIQQIGMAKLIEAIAGKTFSIDEFNQVVNSVGDYNTISFHVINTNFSQDLPYNEQVQAIHSKLLNSTCENYELSFLMKEGLNVIYTLQTSSRMALSAVRFDTKSCKKIENLKNAKLDGN